MPILLGLKEKVHLPLYDAFVVPGLQQTFGGVVGAEQRIRFFVDIHTKTRLETNLPAAGGLPSLNTFEARAMRVVVSQPGLKALLLDHCIPILEAAVKATRFRKKAEWKVQAFCDVLEDQLATTQVAAAIALAELIYSSVTSLIVGEKVMIEMRHFGSRPVQGSVLETARSPTTARPIRWPRFASRSR